VMFRRVSATLHCGLRIITALVLATSL
jgi:hypothetical protein